MIVMRLSKELDNMVVITCSLPLEIYKMLIIHSSFVNSTKIAMQLLECIPVEQRNLLMKKNGRMLMHILCKLRRQSKKSFQSLQQSENVDLIMIGQNGLQRKNSYKYFLVIFNQQKNISYPYIYTIGTLEMIFLILQQKIEINSPQGLYIHSQEPRKNLIELQIWIFLLELMGVASKQKKIQMF